MQEPSIGSLLIWDKMRQPLSDLRGWLTSKKQMNFMLNSPNY